MQSFIGHSRLDTIPVLLALGLAAACGDSTSPARPESPRGSIHVSIATTGTDLDPDGYVLVVDSTSHPVGINDAVDVGGLSLGDTVHTLRLDGVAANCVAQPDLIGVSVQQLIPVVFTVSCFSRSIPPAFATTQLLFVREGQIYRTTADGSGLVALGAGAQPAWSPDGQRIAFTRHDSIYVMDANGANARFVAPSGRSLVWSPDGSRLAFISTDSSTRYAVAVVPADGSTAPVRIGVYGDGLAWSPDGSRIATPQGDGWGNFTVVVVTLDSSNARVLTEISVDFDVGGGVAWSPDGARIALGGDGLALVNADGSGLEKISSLRARNPVWSPDGQAIAFGTVCWIPSCSPSVFYVTADGSTTGLLIGNASSPSWRK